MRRRESDVPLRWLIRRLLSKGKYISISALSRTQACQEMDAVLDSY
jgi:hypothetical protein